MYRGRLALALVAAAPTLGWAISTAVAAAPPTGAIAGVVTNASGAPLAGFAVAASDGVHSGGANTAADGSYTILSLPAGSYTVTFTPPQPPFGQPDTANYLSQTYSGRSPS